MKVGDRVRFKSSPYVSDEIKQGKTGRIQSIDYDEGEVMYNILPDEGSDTDWPFYEGELELIE